MRRFSGHRLRPRQWLRTAWAALASIAVIAGVTNDLPIALPRWLLWLETFGRYLRTAPFFYGTIVVATIIIVYVTRQPHKEEQTGKATTDGEPGKRQEVSISPPTTGNGPDGNNEWHNARRTAVLSIVGGYNRIVSHGASQEALDALFTPAEILWRNWLTEAERGRGSDIENGWATLKTLQHQIVTEQANPSGLLEKLRESVTKLAAVFPSATSVILPFPDATAQERPQPRAPEAADRETVQQLRGIALPYLRAHESLDGYWQNSLARTNYTGVHVGMALARDVISTCIFHGGSSIYNEIHDLVAELRREVTVERVQQLEKSLDDGLQRYVEFADTCRRFTEAFVPTNFESGLYLDLWHYHSALVDSIDKVRYRTDVGRLPRWLSPLRRSLPAPGDTSAGD